MKSHTYLFSALAAVAALAGSPARGDNMASVAIAPATGAVTLTPRWVIGGSLAGFHLMAQDLSLGGGANQFYSIKGTTIPAGGDIAAFTRYIAGSGAATDHADIGSKLTPDSYSALTSADPDLGYGSVNLYFIHHKTSGDYFTAIIPSSGTASAVTDEKPMSGPGGPATLGASGYFGLTFAAANLGYGLNYFYYFRTDPVTGFTKFGTLDPALLGTSADKFDLGLSGYNALAFTGTDVGFGTDKMYYLRLDPITGFTILGTLHPTTGKTSDIANLGSVYSTLTFVPGDVGFGSGNFYTTGAVNTTWQSISFAAIADRLIGAGSFTVTPTASSGLAVTLTVVTGSVGAASISGPVAGVFTVTPTAPGLITLQATQAGVLAPTPYEFNMLRQSFTASGATLLAITTQPTSQNAVVGTTATFSVVATGTSTLSYQWRKAGADITGNASATTATLSLTNVQTAAAGSYDVVVTNTSGSILSDSVLLAVNAATPIITNSPLTAAGTVGTWFSFTITASGTPTSYAASPLPAGLSIVAATGVISGTPTAVGTTSVLLEATNASGTDNATLSITIAAAGVAPIITNTPLTAGGTVGTSFTFTITASGSPTAYTATPLPAGLSIAAGTGIISGPPTAVGTTSVLLGATNASGTGHATLTITVAAAGVAPLITNTPLTAAGTIGTPFGFTITASGSPTVYTATPLPAGLHIVAATGAITGTPTAVGTTSVLLGATNATGTGHATLTITVAAAGVAPIITNSPLTAAGTIGTPFSFSIVASGSPTSYTATPLPAGLSIVAATGVITGTPTAVGTTSVHLGATNTIGTGTATLTITVAAAGVAPIITNSPLSAAGTVGTPFSFTITASGTPTSYSATPLPAGLSIVSATGIITGTPATAGSTNVTLGATNTTGTGHATLTITVVAASAAPVISTQPGSQTIALGGTATFTVVASGTPAPSYQWSLDGQPIAGATSATLVLSNVQVDDGGIYTVTITNSSGSVTSQPATLHVLSSRIVNFSARAMSGPGDQTLIIGFVVDGAAKNLLVRGIGPTLASQGVVNPLADPNLTLFGPDGTADATNDDWGTDANGQSVATTMAATATRLGAFALPSGSKDSALLFQVGNGVHTTSLLRPNSTTGIALTEIYDADDDAGVRLVNVSARMNVAAGESTLIAGFVLVGDTAKTLLIRGVGPSLTAYNVAGVLADPQISVYSGGTLVATNDDWSTDTTVAAQINTVSARVGAFALTAGSKDAALLLTLQPGAYTVQVAGAAGSTGVALVEVYDAQ